MRDRAYTRKMRAKAIKRKKRIVSHWRWFEDGYYPHDGMYSKNKIHCSCKMCRSRDYNGNHVLTIQEKRNGISLKYPTISNEIDAAVVELVDTPA